MTLHYLVTDVDQQFAEQLQAAIHQEFDIPLSAFEVQGDDGRKSLCIEHEKIRTSIPFHRMRNFVNGFVAGHNAGREYQRKLEVFLSTQRR